MRATRAIKASWSDPVEELRQVKIHGYLGARFDVALDLLDDLVGRAPGPEADAGRLEPQVEERAQHLRYRLLDHPIDDGRNPKQPWTCPWRFGVSARRTGDGQ